MGLFNAFNQGFSLVLRITCPEYQQPITWASLISINTPIVAVTGIQQQSITSGNRANRINGAAMASDTRHIRKGLGGILAP